MGRVDRASGVAMILLLAGLLIVVQQLPWPIHWKARLSVVIGLLLLLSVIAEWQNDWHSMPISHVTDLTLSASTPDLVWR